MKRIWLVIVVALMMVMNVQAQKQVVGMRMEVAEIEQNDNEYCVFTYMDNEDSFGYYLSLGHVTRLMDILFDPEFVNTTFDHIDETCLYLGETYDEAYDALGDLLDLCDEEVGTLKEFSTRESKNERLGEKGVTYCQVEKKTLGGKRLGFFYAKGAFTNDLHLTKSAIKELRMGMKIDKKLHPKQHKYIKG